MVKLKVILKKNYDKLVKEKEIVIFFSFCVTPFGKCLVGLLDENICHFSFVSNHENENFNILTKDWPGAQYVYKNFETVTIIDKIFDDKPNSFEVVMIGTSFEALVWYGLLNIKKGETITYTDLAKMIGKQSAVRAVSNAVAKNPVAYLVPCHRVIKKNGQIHKYRWGTAIKEKLLKFEGSI